jgi:hypothetical protein
MLVPAPYLVTAHQEVLWKARMELAAVAGAGFDHVHQVGWR